MLSRFEIFNFFVSDHLKFKSIAVSSVTKILKKLTSNKAVGINGIPNQILKDSCEIISVLLIKIFNYCIEHKTFLMT